MTIYTANVSRTLQEGDTVVLGGQDGTVKKCHCGDTWLIKFDNSPSVAIEFGLTVHNTGHDTLEALTESVRRAFAKEHLGAKEVPALAAGQTWRTRKGNVVRLRENPGQKDGFRVVEEDKGKQGEHGTWHWWYMSHSTSKAFHTPGVHEAGHEDDLVELIEAEKPVAGAPTAVDPAVLLKLTPRQAETLLIVTRNIGGSPELSRRGDTAEIQRKLEDAGVGARWEDGHVVGVICFKDEKPAAAPKTFGEPIFKVGQVWRTRENYLMRVVEIRPDGIGKARVIHAPQGEPRQKYEKLWGIHPKGGYASLTFPWDDENQRRFPEGNKADRFAFVEKISD